ncbi:kelch repeat protein [Cooperia oncophora]
MVHTFRLDPRVGKWEKVSPMSTCRRYLACSALDGHLYAMGGEDESERSLNSVEKYNPTTDQWTAVTPMNERRSNVGGGVVNKKLYASGGYDGATNINLAKFSILRRMSGVLLSTRTTGDLSFELLRHFHRRSHFFNMNFECLLS